MIVTIKLTIDVEARDPQIRRYAPDSEEYFQTWERVGTDLGKIGELVKDCLEQEHTGIGYKSVKIIEVSIA